MKINNCNRCNGTGYIGRYKHIEKGICFECRGNNRYNVNSTLIRTRKTPKILNKINDPESLLYGNISALEHITDYLYDEFNGDECILSAMAHDFSKN